MPIKKDMLLGAHVSIAGGLENAILEGETLGCSTIQIFTRNNRQWSFDTLSDQEAESFHKAQKISGIKIVVSHASYLINLGSPKETVREKSLKALRAELIRCAQIKIPYLVLHPGSCLDIEEQSCIKQIANELNKALTDTPASVDILLENTAGQGSSIGHTLEQLAAIRESVSDKKRIGFCIDTCHAFAAGYDLRTEKQYHDFWNRVDTVIGLENVKTMHLNDSKKNCCSHIDRHEDIGKGQIGIQAFKFIMHDKNLTKIPKIIETPKENPADHMRNLNILRKLTE